MQTYHSLLGRRSTLWCELHSKQVQVWSVPFEGTCADRVKDNGWLVAVSEQLYSVPLGNITPLELVWFSGMVSVALTNDVETSVGKVKLPLRAVVVFRLFGNFGEDSTTCSMQPDV